jgi:site-specific DNA recombinase
MTQRAIIYCRVSTKEQVANLSLPVQQRACLDYCERQGISIARVFVEEGESAKTVDRPELQACCPTVVNNVALFSTSSFIPSIG